MLAMKQRVYLAVYVCATRHTWWFSLAGCNLYYADAIFLLAFVVTLNHSSQYSICTQHHTCNTTRHSKLCAPAHTHTHTHTHTHRHTSECTAGSLLLWRGPSLVPLYVCPSAHTAYALLLDFYHMFLSLSHTLHFSRLTVANHILLFAMS